MTLQLKLEVAAGLETLAAAQGLSVEEYLQQLVTRELSVAAPEPATSQGSGMEITTHSRQPRLKHFFDSSVLVPVFYADHPIMTPAPGHSLRRERKTSVRFGRSAKCTQR